MDLVWIVVVATLVGLIANFLFGYFEAKKNPKGPFLVWIVTSAAIPIAMMLSVVPYFLTHKEEIPKSPAVIIFMGFGGMFLGAGTYILGILRGKKESLPPTNQEPESPELTSGHGIVNQADGDTVVLDVWDRKPRPKSDPPTTLDRVCAVIIDRKGRDLDCSDPYQICETDRIEDDLDFDSLDCVDLVIGLEDEFEIQIPDGDESEWETVKQVVEYVERKLAEKQ